MNAIDDSARLERSIASSNVDLHENAGIHQPSDRLVGLRLTSPEERHGAVHTQDRRARQQPQEPVH